ncbi:hypothetical protein D915_005793 [Fasciola hepatica]|uniref:Uncharacterized protein n=1 Tax=Fasciola hepatica TaxID=6192 RepID=A0A4E0RXX2_FASHE|nr:hypothetical protein D915_005793 [Fasciola hepatica]
MGKEKTTPFTGNRFTGTATEKLQSLYTPSASNFCGYPNLRQLHSVAPRLPGRWCVVMSRSPQTSTAPLHGHKADRHNVYGKLVPMVQVGRAEGKIDWCKQRLLLKEKKFGWRKKRLEFENGLASDQISQHHKRHFKYDNKATQETDCQSVEEVQAVEFPFGSLITGVTLPKNKVSHCDRSPQNYHEPVWIFEGSVAGKLTEEGQKLFCLWCYCRSHVKEAIGRCPFFPGEDGFGEDMDIFRLKLGRPHGIVRAVIGDHCDRKNLVVGTLKIPVF